MAATVLRVQLLCCHRSLAETRAGARSAPRDLNERFANIFDICQYPSRVAYTKKLLEGWVGSLQ